MMQSGLEKLSKFVAYILRHNPSAVGIALDEHGWANVCELLDGVNRTGRHIDISILDEIVSTDEKGRYSYNDDKTKIRANQGHSIPVDLELDERIPPNTLYHGTAKRFLQSICQQGIKRGKRNFVHLSRDELTATKVGARHGEVAVLVIDTGRMCHDGHKFYLSENGVWLTDFVPFEYVTEIKE